MTIAPPPPSPKPPWHPHQQNDAFLADIAGLLVAFLAFTTTFSKADPFWSAREYPTPHFPPPFRPPLEPDPVSLHRTISNNKDKFLDLRPLAKTYLAGVGGKVPIEGIGTLLWQIEDDSGIKHKITIKDAYYCSQAPLRLLCPQQWASQREKELGPEHNTSFTTKAHYSRLSWSEFALTVPHDDKTNLPLWRTAPGYHQVVMNAATTPTLTPEAAVVSDDEASVEEQQQVDRVEPQTVKFPFDSHEEITRKTHQHEEVTVSSKDQLELLRIHNKLGHVSFKLLKNMAKQGLIPAMLANIDPPKCPSCIYGKQTKRPWRTKAKPTPIGGRKPTNPGDCVSVDQLLSKTPGLSLKSKDG